MLSRISNIFSTSRSISIIYARHLFVLAAGKSETGWNRHYNKQQLHRNYNKQHLQLGNFYGLRGYLSRARTETNSKQMPFKFIEKEAFIDINSEQFQKKKEQFAKTVKNYQHVADVSCAGGGEKAMEKHVKHHGKMMTIDRINALLDNTDDFLELSLIGGIGMKYGHVPRGNIVTGIGKVQGNYCMILANDGAFKGGAVYPITLKKALRAQEIAQQNQLPCIYLVECGGAFLTMQADVHSPGGYVFYNEAVLSASRIPQIALVCGRCTAGGAYIPTMADEAVIVHKTGSLFVGGPSLVQAALGEVVSVEDLGGATVHCGTSGCTDYFAESETEAFEMARNIVASLNVSCNDDRNITDYEDPVFDIEDVPGIIPAPSSYHDINMYQIIARLVDGSRFHEFKHMFGRCLLTGFAHIEGHLVGIIASQGEINEKEAAKGAHFVTLCCKREVPLVFLQNTSADSQMSSETEEEYVDRSIDLKSQARMLAAVSCATVPKITIIVGNGIGPAHYLMGGKAVSPNSLFAWPNARIAIMEPEQLAEAVARGAPDKDNSDEALKKLRENIERKSSAIYGATRLLNDGIILPKDTRKILPWNPQYA